MVSHVGKFSFKKKDEPYALVMKSRKLKRAKDLLAYIFLEIFE
jgi:hypothetical protein